jgi:hypothetical protein
VHRTLLLLMLAVLAASCDRGASPTAESLPVETVAPTVAPDPGVCEELADEAVELVADIVEQLDETDYAELSDGEAWGDELIALQERGSALDAEASAAGCSAGAIQTAVRASLGEGGGDTPLAELLVSLLAPPG